MNPTVDGLDTEPYQRKSTDPKVSPGAKKIVRNTPASFQTICFDTLWFCVGPLEFFVLYTLSRGCKHV